MSQRESDALRYHEQGRPGKLEVVSTKPCVTARDLSLAYSPGVAEPCLAIAADPGLAYRYTNKGNLVAVLSNGTAVLGLGAIGALAGKPVMEGKAVLFKRFAQVDVFDIELDTTDTAAIIQACQLLEPTFGGINLEDIKAPECFEIEETLKKSMSIPVFHDDQHGTAIISGAALLNALELNGKRIEDIRVVVSGAGASAIACARFYESLGVQTGNILMVDSKGVINRGRTEGMNRYKEHFAKDTPLRTLTEALRGADVFLGCSAKGLVTGEMLRGMAQAPVVFALANPDPEIDYDEARAARPDAIVATGRSDYPNQVNNVLGFPYIFRGALDVRATGINEAMKIAAAQALAALAREPVPQEVGLAYAGQRFEFGPDYIIPKPFDPRLLQVVSMAVAKAACETGVAREPIQDWDAYATRLFGMTSRSEIVMHRVRSVAKAHPKRIVFSDGECARVLEACRILSQEETGRLILLGRQEFIAEQAAHLMLEPSAYQVVDPSTSPDRGAFAEELCRLGARDGFTPQKANHLIGTPAIFGAMMVRLGKADAMVAGAEDAYSDTIRMLLPMLEIRQGVKRAAGFNLLIVEGQILILGDTTLQIDPDARALADIAMMGADLAKDIGIEPKVAMLSFSNFGDSRHPKARKVREAVAILRRERPEMVVDGEMHGDVALLPAFARKDFPHSRIQGDANVLIFPDLDSANIAFKLSAYLGQGREGIGPLLEGLKHPVNVLSFNSTPREIANLAEFSCFRANALSSSQP
ncbi:MAG: NADP-dependent malic enzyme [Armatimonadetes bacterium]|nr:NADP-dependent malic enzyme [Armatimonadota bacterium]